MNFLSIGVGVATDVGLEHVLWWKRRFQQNWTGWRAVFPESMWLSHCYVAYF